MNLIEILKAKGVSDDLIQAIQEDMKANKVYTASEENLDIRYGKLKTQHEGVSKQLEEANALIEEMKKSTKGQEDLQAKITAHEQREAQLQAELEKTKLEAEIKVGLLAEQVEEDSLGYVAFMLKEKGDLALDENGKIKGWDDKVAALKTQLPKHFKTVSQREIIENKLPKDTGDDRGGNPKSLDEALRMHYEDNK